MSEELAQEPPPYTCTARLPQPCDELASSTNAARTVDSEHHQKPTVDQCIAHLKLLEAFHQLREDVATTDGLFGIHDYFVDELYDDKATSTRPELLRKIREKRWAVYVTKAQQRYQKWWLQGKDRNSVIPSCIGPTENYEGFPSRFERLTYSPDDLPPLGKPEWPRITRHIKDETFGFPNCLLIAGLASTIIEDGTRVSINVIRTTIENGLKDRELLAKTRQLMHAKSQPPDREERLAIRRMVSRYWGNSSIFALDLVGAVVRQASFIEKMHAFDWLHSPTVCTTVERLLMKYDRFFRIMAHHPDQTAVPTLDIDLA
ncbi:MAG: hypothetical protein Q9174_006762, partial [Haloplaca sp. 1 TL-2023]